jgi:DNA-binding FrmR family transcriptional regulator
MNDGHVVSDAAAIADLRKRLRRAEGQIGGVIRMLDEGRSCREIVTQLSAVSKAVDKAAFSLISTGLRECLTDGKHDVEEVSAELQSLFLHMA